jgi:Fe-S-cluster-containing dehydrogenase component
MMISRKRFLQISGCAVASASAKLLSGGTVKSAKSVRWAMAVDLGKCLRKQGCTLCIDACHRAHNVPNVGDQAHRIEWIWKTDYSHAFPADKNEYQVAGLKNAPVPVLCNHCENPPCVRVCPTKSTWKRQDGIVMMDFHRCIGCRYCMAACPYGSRSFNWTDPWPHIATLNPNFPARTKGVVEKCNFCEEKVGNGDQPYCVKSCPQEAMVFGDLNDSNSRIRELLRTRFTIRRKPELGADPRIYYIV